MLEGLKEKVPPQTIVYLCNEGHIWRVEPEDQEKWLEDAACPECGTVCWVSGETVVEAMEKILVNARSGLVEKFEGLVEQELLEKIIKTAMGNFKYWTSEIFEKGQIEYY